MNQVQRDSALVNSRAGIEHRSSIFKTFVHSYYVFLSWRKKDENEWLVLATDTGFWFWIILCVVAAIMWRRESDVQAQYYVTR